MAEFEITERTEAFTLDEVFSFIDETNIGKTDAHELKSRIVDMVQAERSKAIDEFVNLVNECSGYTPNCIEHDLSLTVYTIHQIAEQLKGVRNDTIRTGIGKTK